VPDADNQPFEAIALNESAPGAGRAVHELRSVQSALAYVLAYVSIERQSKALCWPVAIAALKGANDTGRGFSHARAALLEALENERWVAP